MNLHNLKREVAEVCSQRGGVDLVKDLRKKGEKVDAALRLLAEIRGGGRENYRPSTRNQLLRNRQNRSIKKCIGIHSLPYEASSRRNVGPVASYRTTEYSVIFLKSGNAISAIRGTTMEELCQLEKHWTKFIVSLFYALADKYVCLKPPESDPNDPISVVAAAKAVKS